MPQDALHMHIQDQQDIASRLAALLSAMRRLKDEATCEGGQIVIAEICEEMAAQLSLALDTVNLPEASS